MSLQAKIKVDMVSAMKNKDEDVKSLLRVVLGEFNQVDKEVSDEVALGIIKKMKKNATEMNNQEEIEILDRYLPTMLEPKQLETLIKGIINKNGFEGKQDMGKIMGILKSEYNGTYDGRLASEIVRNNL